MVEIPIGLVMLAVFILGGGTFALIYWASRLGTSDELDARGIGRKIK